MKRSDYTDYDQLPLFLNAETAAKLLGISLQRLRAHARRGIPCPAHRQSHRRPQGKVLPLGGPADGRFPMKRTLPWQTPARNYYPLPKVLCRLGLSPGEIAVYSFLMYCENRTTYQCYPSYRTIGEAVGMSRNTVAKYVRQLEEKGLIRTERTTVTLKDGRKRNGSLLYTILPPEQAVEQFNRRQLAKAEAAAERRRVQDTLAKQAAEAPPSPL